MVDLLTEIKNEEEPIREGGGQKAIESQHNKGRLTARQRIAKLIDPKSPFFELAIYAAYEMYEEWGGESAAGTLVEIKLKPMEREGKKVDEAHKKELYESVRKTYERQTDPRYAAARLWVDAIIDPAQTRDAIIWALEAAALNADVREFKTGVLQT